MTFSEAEISIYRSNFYSPYEDIDYAIALAES